MKTLTIVPVLGLAFVSLASASPIVCATGENLQQVINAGGCTLGDLLFSNIVYQNNQLTGTPVQIAAAAVTIGVGNSPRSLSLLAGWNARNTQQLQIVFNYTLTSTTAPITGLGSGYNVSGPNVVGQGKCTTGCVGSPVNFSNTTVALSTAAPPNTPLQITNTITLGPSAGTGIIVNHVSIITNSVLTPVPEPGPIGLVLSGMLALVGTRYWKKKKLV